MNSRLLREYIEIINEAQNYIGMFSQILNILNDKSFIEHISRSLTVSKDDYIQNIQEQIDWARKYLRKNDRVVWWLRWVRVQIAVALKIKIHETEMKTEKMIPNINLILEELQKIITFSEQKSGLKITGGVRFGLAPQMFVDRTVRTRLEHYYALPIPEIQNFVLRWEPSREIIQIFSDIEQKWKEEQDQFIKHDPEDGKVIMQFPDGFAWVNLGRSSCDAEAKAMGHCGNGFGNVNDTILSLRQLKTRGDKKYWHPFLTFILDREGYLGETKGRANEKPQKRYHPYIIALLKSPMIKGIKGGGYMPQSNFEMSDLDVKDADELMELKPELATVAFLYRKYGLTDLVKEKINVALKENSINHIGFDKDNDETYLLEEYPNLSSLVAAYGDDQMKYCNKIFDGEEHFDNFNNYGYDEDGARTAFDDLPTSPGLLNKGTHHLIGKYLVENCADDIKTIEEEYDEEFDPTNSSEIFNMIVRLADENDNEKASEIYTALKRAANDGYRVGAESEMYRDFEKVIKNGAEYDTGDYRYDFKILFNDPDDRIVWDSSCWLYISTQDVIHLIVDPESIEEMYNFSRVVEFKLEQPRYGWDGYDKEAVLETFFEEYPEFNPDKIQKEAA